MDASLVVLLILVGLVAVTGIADLQAVRRGARRDAKEREPKRYVRAAALFPFLCLQGALAALAILFPLSASAAVSRVIAGLLIAGVVALVAVSAGLGLANWRSGRQTPLNTPPPALTLAPGDDVRAIARCVVRPTAGELGYRIALLITMGVFALDLIPWALDQIASAPGASGGGGLPGGIGALLDGILLVIGVIGLGMLLAALVTVAGRRTLTADAQRLRLRIGLVSREIPWQRARRFLVRQHANGQWSYQLIGSEPRDILMWSERPTPAGRRSATLLTTSELAAICLRRANLRPEFLMPEETDRRIRQLINTTATTISDRARRLTQ